MTFPKMALRTSFVFGFSILSSTAFGEATVTAEKSCVVKVEGENFEVGNRLFVYRSVKGRDRNLAIIEIRKRIDSRTAIGKVVKGPRLCFDFKGASVRPVEATAAVSSHGEATPGRIAPRGEAYVAPGVIFLSQAGLVYPGTTVDASASRLKSFGVRAGAEIYPLAFFKKNPISDLFGLGFRAGYATVFPDSEVVDLNTGQGAGKLSTKMSDVQIDFIIRYLWLHESASTELRPALYLSDSVQHTFSGEKKNATPTLTNVWYSGMGVGFRQKLFLTSAVRMDLGMTYGIQIKGEGASPLGGSKVPMAKPGGYIVDAGGQLSLKTLLIGAGVFYSTFSGTIEAITKSSGKVHSYALNDSRIGLFLTGTLPL